MLSINGEDDVHSERLNDDDLIYISYLCDKKDDDLLDILLGCCTSVEQGGQEEEGAS